MVNTNNVVIFKYSTVLYTNPKCRIQFDNMIWDVIYVFVSLPENILNYLQ